MSDQALSNPEFSHAAQALLGVCRNHLAKKGNKSPTAKELLAMAKTVLETNV